MSGRGAAPRIAVAATTSADAAMLAAGFAAARLELGVASDFPPEVDAEASAVAAMPPGVERAGDRPPDVQDATDLPFVTLDPPGSRDLDQAMCLQRNGSGYRVWYAIADVAWYVRAGGAIDGEAHRRGVTLYAPDGRTPLHPPVLSEGAASLLPDVERRAVLWRIDLDEHGVTTGVDVRRARVRSREQADYQTLQRLLGAGTPPDWAVLLREIGGRRLELERRRGAVDVRVPDQEVEVTPDGYRLVVRRTPDVERWNAQISLMTGMAAAELMLAAGVGVLRTMPAPRQHDLDALRRAGRALGVAWPEGASYQEVVRTVDASTPGGAAFLEASTSLLRGAGYTAFDGTTPELTTHSAVAAPYAHVTAPLRRLVDRYASEVCLAVAAGAPVPAWVRDALPALPATMARADQRAHALDRAVVDLVEAVLLRARVGETFDAVALSRRDPDVVVQLTDPPVRAMCSGEGVEPGQALRVRLTEADPTTRRVRFAPGG